MFTRDATTRWTGGLHDGSGSVAMNSSGTAGFTVSTPLRFGEADGQTSPEELVAAAHSACLAMNLSGVLGSQDLVADRIDVSSEVTLGKDADDAWAVTGIAVTLRAVVPGVDAARFAELAATAERTCPISKVLAGTTITLDAALES
jgi:lipoyl-dependent peroxiredoxin